MSGCTRSLVMDDSIPCQLHISPPFTFKSDPLVSLSRRGNSSACPPTHCSILQALSYCMPPKQPLRDRAWGTRYDSLDPSPPISPQKQAFPTPISTPVSRPSSVDINIPDVPDRALTVTTPQFTRRTPHQHDKMPHDASIFVGRYEQRVTTILANNPRSLPSTVEIPELTRLLREHLSQHAEVKNVKIVRDPSKSGTCAFVQCQVCLP